MACVKLPPSNYHLEECLQVLFLEPPLDSLWRWLSYLLTKLFSTCYDPTHVWFSWFDLPGGTCSLQSPPLESEFSGNLSWGCPHLSPWLQWKEAHIFFWFILTLRCIFPKSFNLGHPASGILLYTSMEIKLQLQALSNSHSFSTSQTSPVTHKASSLTRSSPTLCYSANELTAAPATRTRLCVRPLWCLGNSCGNGLYPHNYNMLHLERTSFLVTPLSQCKVCLKTISLPSPDLLLWTPPCIHLPLYEMSSCFLPPSLYPPQWHAPPGGCEISLLSNKGLSGRQVLVVHPGKHLSHHFPNCRVSLLSNNQPD